MQFFLFFFFFSHHFLPYSVFFCIFSHINITYTFQLLASSISSLSPTHFSSMHIFIAHIRHQSSQLNLHKLWNVHSQMVLWSTVARQAEKNKIIQLPSQRYIQITVFFFLFHPFHSLYFYYFWWYHSWSKNVNEIHLMRNNFRYRFQWHIEYLSIQNRARLKMEIHQTTCVWSFVKCQFNMHNIFRIANNNTAVRFYISTIYMRWQYERFMTFAGWVFNVGIIFQWPSFKTPHKLYEILEFQIFQVRQNDTFYFAWYVLWRFYGFLHKHNPIAGYVSIRFYSESSVILWASKFKNISRDFSFFSAFVNYLTVKCCNQDFCHTKYSAEWLSPLQAAIQHDSPSFDLNTLRLHVLRYASFSQP